MARLSFGLGALLVTFSWVTCAQLPPAARSPDPSQSPRPPCLLSPLPSSQAKDDGDDTGDGSDRAAADLRTRAASARRAALSSQLDCLTAYEADLTASIDQLQGIILPDTEAQLVQTRAQRDALKTARKNVLSLRQAREAENAALSKRLDALLARSEAAREEQMQLVDAAASGGEAARAEAEMQECLVKEIRALVPRVEALRGQRETEKACTRGCRGAPLRERGYDFAVPPPLLCRATLPSSKRRRRAAARCSRPTALTRSRRPTGSHWSSGVPRRTWRPSRLRRPQWTRRLRQTARPTLRWRVVGALYPHELFPS